MSKTQNIRASRDSKVFDEIALAGSMLYGDLAPDDPAVTDPNVLNATDYTQYFQQTTKNVFQKRNGVWPNIPIATYGGAAGDLNNVVSLGGESLVGVPPVIGPNAQIKGLTSTGGTVTITDNGTSLDLEVQNISGGAKNNFTATRFPNSNDNLTDGYTPGSVWVDTALDSGNKSFTCVRSSLTSAIWKPTSNELYFQVDVPDNQQDSQFGFLEGSVIYTPDASYVCVDNTVNQAKWAAYGGKEGEVKWEIRKELNPSLDEAYNIEFKNDGDAYKIKNNYNISNSNLNNPDNTFNENAGYSKGSVYVNNQFIWNCVDNDNATPQWDSSLGMGISMLTNPPTFDDDAQYTYNLFFTAGVTVGATAFIGSNYLSNRDPTALDGNTRGYDQGSYWFNSTLKKLWIYDGVTDDWLWINQGGSPPPPVTKAVAHWGFKYVSGVGTRPTYDSPALNPSIIVPLRLGGAPGVNTTWAPLGGHDPSSLFINANQNSENLALQYIGTSPGWYTVDLYLKAQKASPGPTTDWIIQLWSDTNPNAQTISFLVTDPQIENEEETATYDFSLSEQSVTFLRYFTPNEFIGVAVKPNAASGFWTTLIDNISIKLAPA